MRGEAVDRIMIQCWLADPEVQEQKRRTEQTHCSVSNNVDIGMCNVECDNTVTGNEEESLVRECELGENTMKEENLPDSKQRQESVYMRQREVFERLRYQGMCSHGEKER